MLLGGERAFLQTRAITGAIGEEGAGRCQDQAQLQTHRPASAESSGETPRIPRAPLRTAGSA